jgi:2-amino-4-hydroxy-6-hydroxymethyldihydropteridine diphosphokinase
VPRVFIGLGSNLGNREENICKARKLLIDSEIKIIKESSIAETAPIIVIDQPKFLNQIIIAETELTPEKLLKKLKSIEIIIGRKTTIPKGPRIIDIDILLYNKLIVEDKNLKIPHPDIKNRKFILDHLAELDPDLTDPLTGKKYLE